MGKIKLVVFDLDGTILDTLDDIRGSINYVLKCYDIPLASKDDVRRYVGNGFANALKAAIADKCGSVDISDEFPQMLALLRRHYSDNAMHYTTPYPGMEGLFSSLIGRGVKVGVLTNKDESVAKKLCAAYYPRIPFLFVEGKKENRALKPDAALSLSILDHYGFSSDEVAIVGDSDVDYRTAENIKAPSFIVSYGFRSAKELGEKGIVNVFPSVSALKDGLEKLLFV